MNTGLIALVFLLKVCYNNTTCRKGSWSPTVAQSHKGVHVDSKHFEIRPLQVAIVTLARTVQTLVRKANPLSVLNASHYGISVDREETGPWNGILRIRLTCWDRQDFLECRYYEFKPVDIQGCKLCLQGHIIEFGVCLGMENPVLFQRLPGQASDPFGASPRRELTAEDFRIP